MLFALWPKRFYTDLQWKRSFYDHSYLILLNEMYASKSMIQLRSLHIPFIEKDIETGLTGTE